MYEACVPVVTQGLKGLRGVLSKAADQVEARGIDPEALLRARLYPDMFPLIRQVQIGCDFAKGAAARLAGVDVPAWPDDETTFQQLQARIDHTLAFIGALDPAAFDGSETRLVHLTRRGETLSFEGQAYLLEQALPNFWFHVTTAYAILRHNGVEVGKRDFLAAA
jgi:hypothetical protein